MRNFTPLSFSAAEKSVTAQTNKGTVNSVSQPYYRMVREKSPWSTDCWGNVSSILYNGSLTPTSSTQELLNCPKH